VKGIGRAFADSGYDYRDDFNHASSIGAEPVIKPRRNSTGRSRGSYARAKVAREFLTDPVKWKKDHDYGQRLQVESLFPSFL
jgi:hypothetical protein